MFDDEWHLLCMYACMCAKLCISHLSWVFQPCHLVSTTRLPETKQSPMKDESGWTRMNLGLLRDLWVLYWCISKRIGGWDGTGNLNSVVNPFDEYLKLSFWIQRNLGSLWIATRSRTFGGLHVKKNHEPQRGCKWLWLEHEPVNFFFINMRLLFETFSDFPTSYVNPFTTCEFLYFTSFQSPEMLGPFFGTIPWSRGGLIHWGCPLVQPLQLAKSQNPIWRSKRAKVFRDVLGAVEVARSSDVCTLTAWICCTNVANDWQAFTFQSLLGRTSTIFRPQAKYP